MWGSGFLLFYPCWIILSHIPIPALGKDKKKTAARRLRAGGTLIRDVIVMSKLRNHVASQLFRIILKSFFKFFFQYKLGIKW